MPASSTRALITPPYNDAGLNALGRAVAAAERLGVNIAAENTRFPAYNGYIYKNIPSGRLTLCYDTGHEHCYTKEKNILDLFGDRLTTTHIHDNDGGSDQHHLMGEGLIRVSGIGESRGGKPPVMLSIEPDAFHVIGLDIGSGTLLRGLRWNAAGETVQQVELPFRNTFEEILEKSAHLIQKLVGRDSCVRVAGICAAVSGIVDREKNEVHLSANFPLAGKHFADCLGEKCGYEILLENRSRVSAECERYFGAAKGCGDFLFVTAEKSIGSTLYSNGRLFQGWNGAAGEIRSIPVLVDGMLMPLEKAYRPISSK